MVSGVIQRVNNKAWKDKTFYSFTLSGQEGWFNTGVKRPPAQGTSVKFNFKTNDKGYNDVDGSIEVLSDGVSAPTGTVAAVLKSNGSGGAGGSAYWDRKEARDVANDTARELGASRNTAISLIDLALKYEVLPLPAGKAKREEFLFGVLDKYTRKLMGKEEVKDEVKEKVPEAEPALTYDPQSDNWN